LCPQPIQEFINKEELNALMQAQNDLKYLELQQTALKLKVENMQLRMKLTYQLSNTDQIDSITGLITRQ
jgi:cell shape-determining protein MreC